MVLLPGTIVYLMILTNGKGDRLNGRIPAGQGYLKREKDNGSLCRCIFRLRKNKINVKTINIDINEEEN